jgi:hypothetical protein
VEQYDPQSLHANVKAVAHVAPAPLPSGQASQGFLVADVNGDGNPDNLALSTSGLVVQLLDSGGNVIATKTSPVGFTPSAFNSHVIAADFNGDGKLDVAVSYAGDSNLAGGKVFLLLGNGDGTFSAPQAVNAGTAPLAIATADFNGDGKPDLAVASLTVQSISVLLGNGNGTFRAPVAYSSGQSTPDALRSLLAVDLNGDGFPDLAATTDLQVSVLLNSGGGTFGQPLLTSVPFRPNYLAYADLNHDGKLDLAAAGMNNAVLLLFGKGDGTFQPPAAYATGNAPASLGILPIPDGNTQIITADQATGSAWLMMVGPDGTTDAPQLHTAGGQMNGVAAGDLNGDGLPDVVVVGTPNDLSVLLSQGTTFSAPVGYSLGSPGPQAVAMGDLNGDGKLDVVVANLSGPSVSVLLGNGNGALNAPTNTTINQTPRSIVLADFNHDGKLDAAVAAAGSLPGTGGSDMGGVVVLLGKGDGTFQTPTVLTAGTARAVGVAAGDVNGDGKLDLVAVMISPDYSLQPVTLAVFLGNGNGTFAPAITTKLQVKAQGTTTVAIGDLNGDGKPDLAVTSDNAGVDILLGNGDGTFREIAQPTADTLLYGVALADLNGDGKLDLLVLSYDGAYLLGNGDGTFQPEIHVNSGLSPAGMAVAKISGNPAPVVVYADQNTSVVALQVLEGEPASALSAAPPTGSTTAQTFTFNFSDANGYQNLSVVDVLINNALDGRHACYVAFVPSGANGGSVFLVDDAGDAGGPYQGLVLPGGGSISNGQCTISGAGSSAVGSGNTLTLTLAITFNASFTGDRVFYLSAQDKTLGSSGWQPLDTWALPAAPSGTISLVSLSPAQAMATTGTPLALSVTLTDTKGAGDFGVVDLLVNNFIDGRNACYLAYVAAANTLYLVDNAGDAGGPFAGGMVLNGAAATIQNSQCSVNAVGSSAAKAGNTLTLTLNVTFQAGLSGNQIVWLAARDGAGANNTGWQPAGTVAIQ